MYIAGILATWALMSRDSYKFDKLPAGTWVIGFLSWPSGHMDAFFVGVVSILGWAGAVGYAYMNYLSREALLMAEKQEQIIQQEAKAEADRIAAEKRANEERAAAEAAKKEAESLAARKAARAAYRTPFAWEAALGQPLERLLPGSDVIDQTVVDAYVATNREFWKSLFLSLQNPEIRLLRNEFESVRELAYACRPTGPLEISVVGREINVLTRIIHARSRLEPVATSARA